MLVSPKQEVVGPRHHIAYAEQLRSLADLRSPHFLFQVLFNAIDALGLSYETAAAWLLGPCYGGMAVLIGHEIERRDVVLSPLRTLVLVTALLLASHIFLLTIFRRNLYRGYFVPIAYHNPTQQLNKLFALWIYFVYRSQFLSAQPARLSSIPVLAVPVRVVGAVEAVFLIAFVPTAAMYAARDLIARRWRQVLVCIAGIGVPSALILVWQTHGHGVGTPVQVASRRSWCSTPARRCTSCRRRWRFRWSWQRPRGGRGRLTRGCALSGS